jgi:hypothetical protein
MPIEITSAQMTTAQAQAWTSTLKAGDTVAVRERGRGVIFTRLVIRKTPSGRVVLQGGATYSKDGRIFGSSAERTICPVGP